MHDWSYEFNLFESTQIKRCYLNMHNIPQTHSAAHLNVNREGNQKFLKFDIVSSSFLHILFLFVVKYLSKLHSYFNQSCKMDIVFSFYDRRICNCPLLNNCDGRNHLNKGWYKKIIRSLSNLKWWQQKTWIYIQYP